MFAVASGEADLDGQWTWHVQSGAAEPHHAHPPLFLSASISLYRSVLSLLSQWFGLARGQYNGSQCLERLKARAALFKCPEISFQGDGFQLP